nr:hypothetical protein [Anaeromassilibacillus senegalensis]
MIVAAPACVHLKNHLYNGRFVISNNVLAVVYRISKRRISSQKFTLLCQIIYLVHRLDAGREHMSLADADRDQLRQKVRWIIQVSKPVHAGFNRHAARPHLPAERKPVHHITGTARQIIKDNAVYHSGLYGAHQGFISFSVEICTGQGFVLIQSIIGQIIAIVSAVLFNNRVLDLYAALFIG